MNLIEIIFAIVLVLVIVKPPSSFRKVVITSSGRLIFAFVVLYLALNHGKVIGILGCLIFIVTLNNDILEGMKQKKDTCKDVKKRLLNNLPNTSREDEESFNVMDCGDLSDFLKKHKNSKNNTKGNKNKGKFSKNGLKRDDRRDYKHGMIIPEDQEDDTVLNNYINRSWSKDHELRYGDLESGDWDNTECKRYLDKCSYDSLRVIRENAPVISRKYSYKKARSILDKLIKESLHNCLRYATRKCTNKKKLTQMYDQIFNENSIDKKYSREDYRRYRSKNFARHAREDRVVVEDSCEINDFGEYYSTDDQYDSGSDSDSDYSSESSSSSESESEYESDYEKDNLRNVKNLNVQNMEIQNMLLPVNSNIPQQLLPNPHKGNNNGGNNNGGNNNPNKKKNCYNLNKKKWVGKKPKKPLSTECGLKKCIECDVEK